MESSQNDEQPKRRYLWWLTLSVVVVLFATAVLPLLPVNQWWIRVGDYPRLQLLIVYVVAIPVLWFFRDRRGTLIAAAALLIACAIQFTWIHTYLPLSTPSVEDARSDAADKQLRVMAANVLETNEDSQLLLDMVSQLKPDLLVLCEIDDRWADDLASLKTDFAFHLVHPQDNGYGIALYSQLQVSRSELRTMVCEGVPSIDADVVLRDGHTVRVFAVHPKPPQPGTDTTKRDAELVLVAREVRDDPSVIVLGDLNDVGWSRTSGLFREISQLMDPRVGRGFYSTFDATSWFMRYPLDYVFHSDDFRVAVLKVLPAIGSDHFPLLIQLSHEPPAEDTQAAPNLDAGDRQDARNAVEAVRDSEVQSLSR